MGLDFTSIPDREGAALYILHTSTVLDQRKFQLLADEINTLDSKYQTILVDINSPDGEKIREFYDIRPELLPVALIIQDDDSIVQQWAGAEIPAADVIVFQLRQISA